jgi:GNAT superfamily N-acetyltransferase
VLRIELLSEFHDREKFDCGEPMLNEFLRQTARQHAQRGISRTFVLINEEEPNPKPILGFFSLTLCQFRSDSLAPEQARRLPREVPALKLGRLAVASSRQRQGLGKILLMGAMERFLEVFRRAGGIGLFVDAKNATAKQYYEQFGFVALSSNELTLFLPVKTIQQALASPG